MIPSTPHPTSAEKTNANSGWYAFVDILPDPTVIVDTDLNLVHCNPVFEKTFGWSVGEMADRSILSIVQGDYKGIAQQLKNVSPQKNLRGAKTRWATKDGRKLNVTLDAAALLDPRQRQKVGLVMTLQGLSLELRSDRNRQILLRMSKALHRYHKTDRLLNYVTRLIQILMRVDGASVIFLDAEKREFYFQMVSFEDAAAGGKLSTIRFPADKGVAGEVYRTGKPLIVADYAKSPYAYKAIDEQAQLETRNLLDVPLRIKERMIGVLCAVNKREGAFDAEDVELLSAIADMVALPIENARINEALRDSYNHLKALHAAKERAVLHLSHELKTPLSVISVSLQILKENLVAEKKLSWAAAYQRAERNLQRLLDMAYGVEDILRGQDGATFDSLTRLPQADTPDATADDDEHFFQRVNIEFLIHELKAPIAVIETNSRLIDAMLPGDPVPVERARRSLGRILRGTRRVHTLLHELLEVGRAEAIYFNCSPFNPKSVVAQVLIEAMESHAAALNEKIAPIHRLDEKLVCLASVGIRLEAQPAAAEVRMVHDEVKFRQIVANLLKNALTYKRRLLLIHLTVHQNALILSVRDDGPGVAVEHKEKIFERFTQVNAFPGVARNGHGLGLAVSRILARAMDGDITLESDLGQGAVFRLTLPLEFDRG